MAKILIGGAGGAPSNNFIWSLQESTRNDYLIGTSCEPSDLFLAEVDERYVVPPANHPEWRNTLLRLLSQTKPDFIHVQNDFEVRALSRIRADLDSMGIAYFLPDADVVENCVDKGASYRIWQSCGVAVPQTVIINNPEDLKKAFDCFQGKMWIRATEGGGGKGALPVDNLEFARIWIDHYKGWGHFTAAELLSSQTVTWLSIWHSGELIVAQGRKRHSWNFGNRTLSGVTGITGVGETIDDPVVDKISLDAIHAVSSRPHGIFAVDMTYDFEGNPRVTEINIGRFFTTHYFFTKAGLNMPEIYVNLGLDGKKPSIGKIFNPLKPGLCWIRGMDTRPVLVEKSEIEKMELKVP